MLNFTTRCIWVLALCVAAQIALAQNARSNPYYNPDKPHHTLAGFRNNYVDRVTQTLPTVARWQWNAWWQGLPKKPAIPVTAVTPDLAVIHGYARMSPAFNASSDKPSLTWIGHATALVQAGGLNVLTDPMFSERAFPVQFAGPRRAQAPGMALDQLPAIDVVLISHNHLDHLDRASIVALQHRAKQQGIATVFLVPLGVKPLLLRWGVESVQELDWWDSVTVQGTEFHFTPTQHWSARGLADESESLWGAWAVLGPTLHWYVAGDTGYSRDFADTQRHFQERQTHDVGGGFDLALLPIGAYAPRWFMQGQHVNPAEALQIHQDLGAKHSVGIHWGTFPLSDEPLDLPPKDLALAKQAADIGDAEFGVMRIGETRTFDPRNK